MATTTTTGSTGTTGTTGASPTSATNTLVSSLTNNQGTNLGTTNTLSEWAGPYVTDMLGRGQAIANSPYQVYQGPLTAGTSPLQTQAMNGIAALGNNNPYMQASNVLTTLASSGGGGGGVSGWFNSPAAFQANDFSGVKYQGPEAYQAVGKNFTDSGIAQQYMNPYVQQALNPVLDEIRRQADITRVNNAGRMTRAGSFGGGRQAILEGENDRGMLANLATTTGKGYSDAYNAAMSQFNQDQQRQLNEAQFGYGQRMTQADLAARYGLEAARAAEQSRQFGSDLGLKSETARAQMALDAAKANSQAASQNYATQVGAAANLGNLANQQARYGLDSLNTLMDAGTLQRKIAQEGITADYNEFLQQRDYPMKQVQFLNSLLQGLPISTQSNAYSGNSDLVSAVQSGGILDYLLNRLPASGGTTTGTNTGTPG